MSCSAQCRARAAAWGTEKAAAEPALSFPSRCARAERLRCLACDASALSAHVPPPALQLGPASPPKAVHSGHRARTLANSPRHPARTLSRRAAQSRARTQHALMPRRPCHAFSSPPPAAPAALPSPPRSPPSHPAQKEKTALSHSRAAARSPTDAAPSSPLPLPLPPPRRLARPSTSPPRPSPPAPQVLPRPHPAHRRASSPPPPPQRGGTPSRTRCGSSTYPRATRRRTRKGRRRRCRGR